MNEKIINLGKKQEVAEESLLNPLSERVNNFKINFAILARKTLIDSESKLNDWSSVAVKFFDDKDIKSDTGGDKPRVLKLKFKDSLSIERFLVGIKKSAENANLQHSETGETHFVNSAGGKNLLFYRKNSSEIIIPLTNHKWGELLDYLTLFFKKIG
jgi:hypothetical protein